MSVLVCALLLLVGRVFAQYPLLTSIPGGFPYTLNIPAAVGPNDEVWIAGTHHVIRLDRDGRPLFTIGIEGFGYITALAVNKDGMAAVTTAENQSGHLVVLDISGRITVHPVANLGQPDSLPIADSTGRISRPPLSELVITTAPWLASARQISSHR